MKIDWSVVLTALVVDYLYDGLRPAAARAVPMVIGRAPSLPLTGDPTKPGLLEGITGGLFGPKSA